MVAGTRSMIQFQDLRQVSSSHLLARSLFSVRASKQANYYAEYKRSHIRGCFLNENT